MYITKFLITFPLNETQDNDLFWAKKMCKEVTYTILGQHLFLSVVQLTCSFAYCHHVNNYSAREYLYPLEYLGKRDEKRPSGEE